MKTAIGSVKRNCDTIIESLNSVLSKKSPSNQFMIKSMIAEMRYAREVCSSLCEDGIAASSEIYIIGLDSIEVRSRDTVSILEELFKTDLTEIQSGDISHIITSFQMIYLYSYLLYKEEFLLLQ